MKKNFRLKITLFLAVSLLFNFVITLNLYSQVELVSVSHPVYDFLKNMQLKGMIKDYNSSLTPISRQEVSSYLKMIEFSTSLTKTEKKIIEDYKIEFEYDMNSSLRNSFSLFNKFDTESLFGNKKQKYIYKYADSNATLFLNAFGDLNYKSLNGDNDKNSILIGDLGLGIRGTLFDKIGYSLEYSSGKNLDGKIQDLSFAVKNEPILKANPNFIRGNNYFDFFKGHFRYQTKNNGLSLTLGREVLNCGYGYIDKMFLSNNTVPIDFLKLDLNYKKINYTFTYATLKGDSIGMDIKSKNIAFHRLNVRFSDIFKVGYFESVIINNNPFSFVYFNPISFITSADLNAGAKETTYNNTMMGFDFEINPIKNLSVQGTFLIDDINFSSIFKNDITSFDNKFGYQVGTMWADAFTLPDVTLVLEYTRLNPFVYTHRFNVNSYTNWGFSLGHSLSPNSDEIAIRLNYNVTNRIKFMIQYQFQRSADGIYFDSTKNQIINYGGKINRGDGDNLFNSKFLLGDIVNRTFVSALLQLEPIKQYFFEFRYKYGYYDLIYLSKNQKESYFLVNFRVII